MSDCIPVIDSHTAGEPTRVVIDNGPPLGDASLTERVDLFRSRFDHFRSAVVQEPRGSDVLVGALLCEPVDDSCDTAVIFFNNVGYLGMCGHGMIGVVETLKHLGRANAGNVRIETPVGIVGATVNDDGSISIENVVSYRTHPGVKLDVPEIGFVVGDVVWGGNVFFLVREPYFEIALSRVRDLQSTAFLIRQAVHAAGHNTVDHVELFAEPSVTDADSRNFVLCPGLEYDRSPCGTGTSAKLACLAADGLLSPGEKWQQEGILGTRFTGTYRWEDQSRGRVIPTITGRAYVTAESNLILSQDDPFRSGIAMEQIEGTA